MMRVPPGSAMSVRVLHDDDPPTPPTGAPVRIAVGRIGAFRDGPRFELFRHRWHWLVRLRVRRLEPSPLGRGS